MSRWMLTLVCAFSVAAVAVAQDEDDWDSLLAGLGDDAVEEPTAAVEVPAPEAVEEDPFADLFDEAGAVSESAAEVAEDVAEDVAEAAEAIPEAAAETVEDWNFDEAFADTADAAESVEAAVEETAVAVETAAEEAAGEDPFADLFGEDGLEAEAAPAEEAAEEAAEAAEAVSGEAAASVEAAAEEAAGEDPFADLFGEDGLEAEAAPAEEAAEEAAETAEAVSGEAAAAGEAVAEEVAGEDPFADFFDDAGVEAEAASAGEPIPEPAEVVVEEVAVVEETIADDGAAGAEIAAVEAVLADEDAFATQEEGEAAAALIRKAKGKDREDRQLGDASRVRPVEPAVKPRKKDKFSSEARTPLKPKTAVPDWNDPVSLDGSEVSAPAKPASRKPAVRETKGAWDEPVVW